MLHKVMIRRSDGSLIFIYDQEASPLEMERLGWPVTSKYYLPQNSWSDHLSRSVQSIPVRFERSNS
jgi:hypothetical protein